MPLLLALAAILLFAGLVRLAMRSSHGGDADVALASQPEVFPQGPSPAPHATEAAGPAATPADPAAPAVVITDKGPHRDLVDIDGWLQSDVASLEELEGRVVVVQFWTFGCINCKNTLPNLIHLYASYGRDQVEVVGIHAAEFEYERDPDTISAAAADLGVTWPIVLDARKRTFHDWQGGRRAFWPRTYVLDREGHIRFDHVGEGAYHELNETVAALVAEPTL